MASNIPDPSRMLSVQSHVVSGYVGNRAATFPLQLLGWDVDVANTVQFSNHTGYGRWGGFRFDSKHLDDLFQGLEKNRLLRYSRMLTGYMPSAAVVTLILELVKKMPEGLIYLLDPVMGDLGRGMYVAQEVLPVYKQMLSLATIVTPNQFEAQVLTGIEIVNLESLERVIECLHTEHGVAHVIITSVELPKADMDKIRATTEGMLQIGSSKGDGRIWMIQFPKVEGYFSGVGDLFAALTLARFNPEEKAEVSPIARAAEFAIASLQGILANTCKVIDKLERQEQPIQGLDEAEAKIRMMSKRELRIIQSRKEIENPNVVYKARWLQ